MLLSLELMIRLSLGDLKLATLTNLCVLFQIIHLVSVLSVIRNKNNLLVVSLDIKKNGSAQFGFKCSLPKCHL